MVQMKYCVTGDKSVNMSQFQITFHDPLGICRMMVCVYVAFFVSIWTGKHSRIDEDFQKSSFVRGRT